jgi:hypothetical protein
VVVTQLRTQWQQRIQQGYAELAAAHALAEQVMANERAFNKSIDKQMAANRAAAASSANSGGYLRDDDSGGGGGAKRSVNDKFDDLYRGVDTTDDPFWGQSQHSNLEKYHWTDGYGNYRDSNDPGYTPSQTEAGDWKLMPESP